MRERLGRAAASQDPDLRLGPYTHILVEPRRPALVGSVVVRHRIEVYLRA